MKVELKKLENYEGVVVKVLLDSRTTGLFIDMKFAKEKRFQLERLKNPLLVQNIDGTVNVGGAITYQVKYNMFFKKHVERAQMDICNLGKIEVILGMLWLAAYNPEIDQKKEEMKMMQYLPICRRRKQKTQEKRQMRKMEEEKTVEELVSRRFWKWKKVFGKKECPLGSHRTM